MKYPLEEKELAFIQKIMQQYDLKETNLNPLDFQPFQKYITDSIIQSNLFDATTLYYGVIICQNDIDVILNGEISGGFFSSHENPQKLLFDELDNAFVNPFIFIGYKKRKIE